MKRGLLLIDRGSREDEVKDELGYICSKAKESGGYQFSDYCFLEVVPPFIEEGMEKCFKQDIDALTIVPYFLYPGKKVKLAVNKAIEMISKSKMKIKIAKPITLHKSLPNIVYSKVDDIIAKNKITFSRKEIDVLLIGHGSKDPNAKTSLQYVVDGLQDLYRNVSLCWLEIEEPNIKQGIDACAKNNPNVLIIVPYFLHRGAHVKRDIYEDLNPAMEKSGIKNIFITDHLGTDVKLIDLVIERAKEVEK
ncbi:MAG TPA: CbiX/SirB N-terminal domain-containing protein [Nitrosopumilaceae archaeon]|nr:CbiX/SirB N-terminal domain-containing protein [Nitrosopumilaceae archaeon]